MQFSNGVMVDSIDIFDSLKIEIGKNIEELMQYKNKAKVELTDSSKKINFIRKAQLENDIKRYNDRIRQYNDFKQSLTNFKMFRKQNTGLNLNVINKLNELCAYLSLEERQTLEKLINGNVSKSDVEDKKNIEKSIKEVETLLSALKIEKRNVMIYKADQKRYSGNTLTVREIVEFLKKEKLSEMTSDFVEIRPVTLESSSINKELDVLTSIEEMHKNNVLVQNDKTKDLVNNFDKIKEMITKKTSILNAITSISNTITSLREEKDVPLDNVIEFLEKVKKERQNALEEIEKYLVNIDFKYLEELTQEYFREKDEEIVKRNSLISYQKLSEKLERVMTEEPNNFDKIKEIQNEMQSLTLGSGLDRAELSDAFRKGKEKYHNEIYALETEKRIREETEKEEREIRNESVEYLRRMAIEELQATGKLDGNYIMLNGDLRNSRSYDEKEAMIVAKMAEIAKVSEMTPEERGLASLKERGIVGESATLNDISSQQRADFRFAYRDSSYDFVENYKRSGNTIYKDYVRYLASIEDKGKAMSFQDFVKKDLLYKSENDTIENVDMKGPKR